MRIKKKNLIICLIVFLILMVMNFLIQMKPIFQVQTKAYFHEMVKREIMESISTLDIPEEFILKKDNNMSIDTNQLNQWIVDVNRSLNDEIKDEFVAELPIGYLSGVVFFQNTGPRLSISYWIHNRVEANYDIKTTTLGINNVMIELILNVECNGEILYGLSKDQLLIQERIPLAIEYVQGEIPQIFPY